MHPPGAVSSKSARLREMHKRALWAAMRAAGGDAKHAAAALGMTVRQLLDLLEGDPASMWSVHGTSRGLTGGRPAMQPPIEDAVDSDRNDDPDGSAW
jgi:hypothetical protein